jgi:hypothetical protein
MSGPPPERDFSIRQARWRKVQLCSPDSLGSGPEGLLARQAVELDVVRVELEAVADREPDVGLPAGRDHPPSHSAAVLAMGFSQITCLPAGPPRHVLGVEAVRGHDVDDVDVGIARHLAA